MIEGGANNDYIYKAGVHVFDESSLENVSKAMRDAAKEQLEAIAQQFDTDPDLKSIVEMGENSPIFEGTDTEIAKNVSIVAKAINDFVEDSLAYETDLQTAQGLPDKIPSRGKNLVELLSMSIDHAEYIITPLGLLLEADKGLNNPIDKDGLPQKDYYSAYQKILSYGRIALGLGIAYAEYSEEVDFYHLMRDHIENNITDENAQRSYAMLKVIDEHINNANKELGLANIDAAGAITNIYLGGIGATKGAAAGAKIPGPWFVKVAGALAGAIGGYVSAKTLADKGTEATKRAYASRGTYGYVPTWSEITGQKTTTPTHSPKSVKKLLRLSVTEDKSALTTLKGNGGDDALANSDERVFMSGGSGDDAVFKIMILP